MNDYEILKCKKNLLRHARRRAKAKGHEFKIGLNDITIPQTCPVLGIQLQAGGDPKNSPSIDRIDNSKGYTPDNILIVSYQANVTRHEATPEEILKVGYFYKKLFTGNDCSPEKLKQVIRECIYPAFDETEKAEIESLLQRY